ncbi:MAG TPA: hypothetical protein VIR56_15270, partial [Solimonas sp.]
MKAMDSARRQRYLKLMGIDTWRLRGAEVAEPVSAAVVSATAPSVPASVSIAPPRERPVSRPVAGAPRA